MNIKAIVEDHVWEYENFLTEQELKILLDVATNTPDERWATSESNPNPEHYDGKALSLTDNDIARPVIDALNERIQALFIDTTQYIQTGFIIRGSSELAPKEMHRDDVDLSSPTGRCDCTYGIVMYLNDDFTGGELVYPELDLEYSPKRGSLVIHRAGELHGVKKIHDGMRYSMTAFMWGCDAQVLGI